MFKFLLLLGSGLFFCFGFFVLHLSFWNMFFLILMAVFFFICGYYVGLLEEQKLQEGYLSKKDVDRMFEDKPQ